MMSKLPSSHTLEEQFLELKRLQETVEELERTAAKAGATKCNRLLH